MSMIHNRKMLKLFMLAVFAYFFTIDSNVYADTQPLWYQYSVAGAKAREAKDYATSQRYYLGALAELEKIAAKKKRIQVTSAQDSELCLLSSRMMSVFSSEPRTQLPKERQLTNNKKDSPNFNVLRAVSDASYVQKLIDKNQDDYHKRKAEIAENVKLFDRNDIDRSRRALAINEVLLGPNSQAFKLSQEVYQEAQRKAADDVKYALK